MTSFAQPAGAPPSYLIELKNIIIEASNNSARSKQTAIGPSEVGEPCARKLAYKLLDVVPTNTATDPLPSLVGTGAHAWLADAFTAHNATLGRQRWFVEQRVQCGDVSGSCDLYDADTHTVIDHKFPGASGMKKYVAEGPSDVYRIQAHLYGLGHMNAGRHVDRVAIVFYPRGGAIGSVHLWSQPYDEAVAQTALDRLHAIAAATDVWMDLTNRDVAATISAIEPTTSHLCNWCPFLQYAGTDLSQGCPGEALKETTHRKGNPS